jgi:lipopolysaccharide export system permease protein
MAFIAVTLASVIMLTQSLRFLELVINVGASSAAFWELTALALPRFLEVILPIALMGAVVFIYNKLLLDKELVVLRAAGLSPLMLARPALVLSGLAVAALMFITMWLTPVSMGGMNRMRAVISAQYSSLLFREGVFTSVVPGLMVFIRERESNGELRGIVIHDSRARDEPPATILAKRGAVLATDSGQQVVVYDGSRQDINPQTGTLNRLEFRRYSLDIPESGAAIRKSWREPEERGFAELMHPNPADKRDVENRRAFFIEANRRIITPLLAPAYAMIALCMLLLGPFERSGHTRRITMAVLGVLVIQALYLAALNIANHSIWGLALMYLLVLAPCGGGYYFLSRSGDYKIPGNRRAA